jgi:FBP C-terminal treble-clef zinc-finger
MFKLDSEAQLLEAFRPRDRKLVELSREVTPPVFVRHYLAWPHPAGGRVYLVFAVPGGAPTGIAFSTSGAGPPVPHLCDWCHCVGLGTGVGLLTARLNSRRTIGVHVCSDLGCQRKLEDQADRAGRSALPALATLVERMGRFATEGLKIDMSPDRR